MSIAQAEITLRQYNDRYCYDGDTCYVTVDGANTKIRLLKLDTPEISKPKCEQELEWGLRARDFINDKIENAQAIEIKTNYELGNMSDPGRIAGNPANNVFAGMNAVSAFGDISKGAQNRIDNRNKTATKKAGTWSKEKLDKFLKQNLTIDIDRSTGEYTLHRYSLFTETKLKV